MGARAQKKRASDGRVDVAGEARANQVNPEVKVFASCLSKICSTALPRRRMMTRMMYR